MTVLAMGLALLPLAITENKPGMEIAYPLAVVLGGLVTSTLPNLFLLPPLYARLGHPVEKGLILNRVILRTAGGELFYEPEAAQLSRG